jgi:hypothetical protein
MLSPSIPNMEGDERERLNPLTYCPVRRLKERSRWIREDRSDNFGLKVPDRLFWPKSSSIREQLRLPQKEGGASRSLPDSCHQKRINAVIIPVTNMLSGFNKT